MNNYVHTDRSSSNYTSEKLTIITICPSDEVDDDSEKPSPSIASYYTTVQEGESTSLLCAFQGVPYPTYRLEVVLFSRFIELIYNIVSLK